VKGSGDRTGREAFRKEASKIKNWTIHGKKDGWGSYLKHKKSSLRGKDLKKEKGPGFEGGGIRGMIVEESVCSVSRKLYLG